VLTLVKHDISALQRQTSLKTDSLDLQMHMLTKVEIKRRVAHLSNAKAKAKIQRQNPISKPMLKPRPSKTNIKNNVKNQC
jgi:hypothetical protein